MTNDELFYKAKAALLNAEPHWDLGRWRTDWDEWIPKYLRLAEIEIENRFKNRKLFNDASKAAEMNLSRSQWRRHHEYWYQRVRDVVGREDRRKFFKNLSK